MTRRSNKEILTAAKLTIETLADWVRRYEQVPGIRDLAQHMASPDNDGTVPAHLRYPYFHPSHPDFAEALARARDSAIFRLWARSKVVYAMDDDLLAYLSDSSASAIPTEIMRNLPHANPYVLLPAPDLSDPETTEYGRHIGVPWGAFVFGRYHGGTLLCSTNDPGREDLGIMFLGFIQQEDEPVIQTLRCTIPLRERTVTVEGAVEATIAGFTFNEHLGEDERSRFEGWLRRYVRQVFDCLVYVCTDEPDIETRRPGISKAGKVKRSGRRQQRRPRLSDINEVVQIGFRLGPGLFAARQRWQRANRGQSATGTGSRQPPNQRRAHYRTFWTGQGRQVPKIRLVHSYWVNLDLLDGDALPTDAVIRPVRPPRP
jgi:hypothetical protein